MVKVLAITQARYGSTRLPAKILKEANGKTLLEIISALLSKNNSPAWRRISNIMSIWNMAKTGSAKRYNTYQGAVDNTGMYGAWGGNE